MSINTTFLVFCRFNVISCKQVFLVVFWHYWNTLFTGLVFKSIEEFEGTPNVLFKCYIENFTSFDALEIAKNAREAAYIQSKGMTSSNLGDAVSISSNIKELYAEIQLSFNVLNCKDEGSYICSVDGGYHKEADVIVKSKYKFKKYIKKC